MISFVGRVHAAALAVQNTFDLNIRYRQSGISAYLLGDLIHTPDHTKFQAAAGSGIWNTVVQPHQVYGPATNICEKNRSSSRTHSGWRARAEYPCGNSFTS